MKVLITGITGLAGYHLYNHLAKDKKYEICGTYNRNKKNADALIDAEIFKCDINDIASVKSVLEQCEPEQIFHFGAYVTVHNSFNNPAPIFQTNVMGTVNVLESIRMADLDCKMLITGSAEEYGKIPQEMMPIKETYALNPVSPYGLSKKLQEEVGLLYNRTYGLDVVLTRTFHYSGPYQPLGFVFSDFAKQIVDIKNGTQDYIKVGNLDAKRDFTDIRDVVSAYSALMEKGRTGEVYNVCSGRSVAIKGILDMMVSYSESNIEIVVDETKLRPSDIPNFVGDNSKLKKDTGWQQIFYIEDTVRDVLDFWTRIDEVVQ